MQRSEGDGSEAEVMDRRRDPERGVLEQIISHAPAMIAVTQGPDHVVDLINPTFEKVLGSRRVLGRPLREALPEFVQQGLVDLWDRVVQGRETVVRYEARVMADLDDDGGLEEYFLNIVIRPLDAGEGAVDRVLTFAVNVTEQVRARQRVEEQATELEVQTLELQESAREMAEVSGRLEETNRELRRRAEEVEVSAAAARAASERLQLLADAGAALGTSLDVTHTLQRLAHLLVPRWADWCFVEVPTPDGRVEPVVVHHSDPAMAALAWEAMRRYPIDPSAPVGTAKVLRTGEPEIAPEIPEEMLRMVARDEEHFALLRQVGFRSHISVPLTSRGRTLGVLSVVMAGSERRFRAEDLPLAQELARRAALALDNSQLFDAERTAREAAERSGERARRLARLSAALNEAATPEDVAAACIEHGVAALDASQGSLAMLSPEGDEFEVVHSSYAPDVASRWRRFPMNPDLPLSRAVLSGEPLLIPNLVDAERRFPVIAESFRGSNTAAFIAIPILIAGRSVGGLSFSFPEPREFSDADATFVATLGQQAAQALERARLLHAERDARAEAESANLAKTEFLSAMSHELRTPLNAIAGYVDLLDLGVHGPITDAQRRDLDRIKHSQHVLLGLINDVLNFARIEAGRIEFRDDAVQLLPLLVDLEGMLSPQFTARQLSFGCNPCEASVYARGDAERIRQILLNLVANAIKFTDPGGRVELRTAEDEQVVRIHVSDTGRGIPSDKLEAIFEPFVQLDRQSTLESQQGVGLGLAISRELARAMGGDLTASSDLERGSEFVLTLRKAG